MSTAKGCVGGGVLAPTDTIQSFLATPEISRVAASFPFFGGFGPLKVSEMKVEEGIFFLLYILLILYKRQETSKGRRIRGAAVKIDWDGV